MSIGCQRWGTLKVRRHEVDGSVLLLLRPSTWASCRRSCGLRHPTGPSGYWGHTRHRVYHESKEVSRPSYTLGVISLVAVHVPIEVREFYLENAFCAQLQMVANFCHKDDSLNLLGDLSTTSANDSNGYEWCVRPQDNVPWDKSYLILLDFLKTRGWGYHQISSKRRLRIARSWYERPGSRYSQHRPVSQPHIREWYSQNSEHTSGQTIESEVDILDFNEDDKSSLFFIHPISVDAPTHSNVRVQ